METGFESPNSFSEAFARTFGQAPAPAPGADCIVISWIDTPLGPMVAASTREGVCLLEYTECDRFQGQVETMRKRFDRTVVPGDCDHLAHLRRELDAYFTGRLTTFTVPTIAPGTPFQEQVWAALLAIPYGQTRSYEDLARSVGNASAQRAVGAANGMNRIAIVIPCHRVVNKNGKLGGYGGLLWRKEALLQLERGLPFNRA